MSLRDKALACRDASAAIAGLDTEAKRRLLHAMANALAAEEATVLAANARDMDAARANGTSDAMLDRLCLDATRIAGIVAAIREVATLPDPVGITTRRETRPNGIVVERVRIPLGVIAMIYEARPNVTADAAALCLMAGNAVILRGGSDAMHSNIAIATALRRALKSSGLPEAALTLIDDPRRETMIELLQLTDIVDLAIPRGGEGLIRFVAEHARVPVIKHYKGVCHLYVDREADFDLALRLLVDGKTSRPGVCNALETLLVHEDIAAKFLPRAIARLRELAVDVRGDDATRAQVADVTPATEDDYAAEFLDLVIAVRVVDNIDEAITHIRRYGSDHTEVIATRDDAAAGHFIRAIRSAVVMVNASSRFSDGGELGLGTEIGISTTRLHAYGPMGAESLTVERFVVRGEGQVRHPTSE
ncbi:glutamate-5-semialdehyde dehydrogenase [Luteibacter rhizovicinus DSM 16549]|uniref:Gamma-glutamyl phosphate reductase n=1 Tax=Luteibacter rhizovicinus DSM 16549 TaxID=1440763 RepID=A0A0G9HCK2_9GAMM|nr:glutamate-5-semialdehyde dehydrogenase [Luteibacter rhizovicinus]APG06277.1 glutamate-5-semialdehyde dehydrogenase [Luteibacter rhizovicinus DSM 16549]KLD67358.1 gamma-glutamyl phosphate reductase [Luteibacter rhizovicinus DSM 16549]KLD77689.1 gamma-glutamyl phosphate reductase [Xanthomonas hyacinthi DSM 19077]